MEWESRTALSSDHLPIICRIRTGKKQATRRATARFAYKKADWTLFEKEIEERLQTMLEWTADTTIKKANYQLTSTILKAAEKAIPRGARRDPKPWWTEEVDNAVKSRDGLRSQAARDQTLGPEWREAEQTTRNIIIKAKQDEWRSFASGLSLRTDLGESVEYRPRH